VTRAAKDYFRLEEGENMTAHTEDGRRFLRDTDTTYDLIILDAYQKDQVPIHLTQLGFMELAEERLSDDGVFLANVIASPSGAGSEVLPGAVQDDRRGIRVDLQLPHLEYGFGPEHRSSRNEGRHGVHRSRTRRASRNERRDVGIDLSGEIEASLDEPRTDDVPVLTEDHAPVDSLQASTVGQKYVIEQTEEETQPEPATIGTGSELLGSDPIRSRSHGLHRFSSR